MEQHNIDSRFKKGLENLDRQPSADAWARLQSQMNAPHVLPETEMMQSEEKEEKRILVWWQFAAAAVVLLFVSIGIIKNGMISGGKTSAPVAVNKPTELPELSKKATEIPAPVLESETKPVKAIAVVGTTEKQPETITGNSNENEVKSAPAKAQKTQLAQVSKKVKAEKTLMDKPEKPIADEMKPARKEEVLIASNQTNNATNPETAETKSTGLEGMAIEVIVKRDNPANALAVNNMPEERENDSKLKSIVKKQAKNLKNIDLQALGLTPDSKLAASTRNIQQKFSKVLDI